MALHRQLGGDRPPRHGGPSVRPGPELPYDDRAVRVVLGRGGGGYDRSRPGLSLGSPMGSSRRVRDRGPVVGARRDGPLPRVPPRHVPGGAVLPSLGLAHRRPPGSRRHRRRGRRSSNPKRPAAGPAYSSAWVITGATAATDRPRSSRITRTPWVARPAFRTWTAWASFDTRMMSSLPVVRITPISSSPALRLMAASPVRGESYSDSAVFLTIPLFVAKTRNRSSRYSLASITAAIRSSAPNPMPGRFAT